MITFGEVLLSLIIGSIFGGLMVFANKIKMGYYNEDYQDWWTPKRHVLFFLGITIVVSLFFMVGYIGNK
jgi:hypothetical protein